MNTEQWVWILTPRSPIVWPTRALGEIWEENGAVSVVWLSAFENCSYLRPADPSLWKIAISQASVPIGIACAVLPTLDRWQEAQPFHMLLCSLGRHGRTNRFGWCNCDRGCLSSCIPILGLFSTRRGSSNLNIFCGGRHREQIKFSDVWLQVYRSLQGIH